MYKCEICEQPGEGGTLAGEFFVVLCPEHKRQWSKTCFVAKEFIVLRTAYSVRNERQCRMTGEHVDHLTGAFSLAQLDDEIRVRQIEMYAFAERWLEEQQAAGREGAE